MQDETAKELCGHFYRALVENTSGARDYGKAFLAATNALRASAHTGGSKKNPRGEKDVTTSNAVLHGGTSQDGSVGFSGASRRDGVGGAAQEGGQETSRRGLVRPWHEEDVVLFLSKDGDTEPIYLWRKPKVPPPLLPAPIAADVPAGVEESRGAEEAGDAALKALFAQHGLGMLCADLCRELGVDGVDDLKHVTPEDLDDLPNYLKDKLKPVHKRKFKAMIASQPSVATLQGQS